MHADVPAAELPAQPAAQLGFQPPPISFRERPTERDSRHEFPRPGLDEGGALPAGRPRGEV